MPEISRFYGLIIYLYFDDNDRHHRPHIHVWYSGDEAVFDIETFNILEGDLPSKATKKIKKWMSLYKKELQSNWKLAVNGQNPEKIKALL